MKQDSGHRPLEGKRIVITRPAEQADGFAECLSKLGGMPVKFPVIVVAPPDSWAAADSAIDRLEEYDWILFTSVNGVNAFMGRVLERKRGIKETLAWVKICTVGLRTAEAVEQYGLQVDFVPGEFRAEAIVAGFQEMGAAGEKILIPRAQIGREILPEELVRMKMKVDVVPVYKIVRPETDTSGLKAMLRNKEIDVVTFTSGSCVRNFIEILGAEEYKILLKGIRIACISPVTVDAARKYGLEADIVPGNYTVDDLVEAIARYYKKQEVRSQKSEVRSKK
ncbi:MAG: uroporphyrinogen-III synthase [Nitrospirota bacterium]|nr:uroporphyrinogen-III synthase [Nitrospirota bacterium]